MSLSKVVTIKSSGVPASFHTVESVTINKSSKNASVIVQSYYSQDAYNAGATSLAQTTIMLNAELAAGQNVWAFADAHLSAAAPAGADTGAVLEQFAAVNPYVFAGATIV